MTGLASDRGVPALVESQAEPQYERVNLAKDVQSFPRTPPMRRVRRKTTKNQPVPAVQQEDDARPAVVCWGAPAVSIFLADQQASDHGAPRAGSRGGQGLGAN